MTRALRKPCVSAVRSAACRGIDGADRDLEDRVTGDCRPGRATRSIVDEYGQANDFTVLKGGDDLGCGARGSSWSLLRACIVPTESTSPSRTTGRRSGHAQ